MAGRHNTSKVIDGSVTNSEDLPDSAIQIHEAHNNTVTIKEAIQRRFVQRQGFFVGGTYVGPAKSGVMRGQMYVEALIPEIIEQPLPIVLIHGGAQTAMNWMITPDGRPGWADWLAQRGWKVYMVDQPARGRSSYQSEYDGPQVMLPPSTIEKIFTAPEDFKVWPQAHLHTQWPGTGHVGDPTFDQFYASCVPMIGFSTSEALMRDAGAALLDRIGPAILMGHSQGGLHCWLISDARPDLVKGVVALEPQGPPYQDIDTRHAVPGKKRIYGIVSEPLVYDPAVTPTSPLEFREDPSTPGAWYQSGTPKKLANFSKIPILVVVTQASYHASFDHFTVRYLLDAGANAEEVRLEDYGILGNGHMMMLEKNNIDIITLVEKLMSSRFHL